MDSHSVFRKVDGLPKELWNYSSIRNCAAFINELLKLLKSPKFSCKTCYLRPYYRLDMYATDVCMDGENVVKRIKSVS